MDIGAEILLSLEYAKELNSATASYDGGSGQVTCSVYKSYGTNLRYETDEHGYIRHYDDLSIMMRASDLTGSLTPLKSSVYVDGVKYMVGNLITTYPTIIWLTLRK